MIAKPKIVAVRPAPRVISGQLPLVHRRMVFAWVRLNETALADYWAGVIGTVDFAQRLRPLPIIEVGVFTSKVEPVASGAAR